MIYLRKLQNRQRRYNTSKEGSITIFLTLTLVLILSFLFSMAEAARVNGLQELTAQKLKLEMESLFGAYNRELWEHYGLLFLDGSYGNGELNMKRMEQHLMEADYSGGEEVHFYQMALKDAEIEKYALATDWEGAEFRRQACAAAKEQLTEEGVDYLKDQLLKGQELAQDSDHLEEKWEKALEAEEEAEKYKEEAQKESGEESGKSENKETGEVGESEDKEAEDGAGTQEDVLPENPIAYVTKLKASPLLTLVLENPSKLSSKGIDRSYSLDNRTLFCGNMAEKQSGSVDKLWFVQYLNQYFTCGTDESIEKHALDYELEYCIAGKETDAENLEAVVKRLLLLREAANFATIMQDNEKRTLASGIALAAVGFTGLPPLIKMVEGGILLAWCYIESILDVRCLLAGGKVSLIKDTFQWKSDLYKVQDEVAEKTGITEEKGLEYREYLQILLFITGQEKLAYRAMDVVERNIQLLSGNEKMRMDDMVSAIRVNAVYSAKPLFFNLMPMQYKMNGSYHFLEAESLSY